MSALQLGLTPKMKPLAPKRSALIAALDIGTSKVACLIGRLKPRPPQDVLEAARVELRGAGLDESPHCYKRLPDVLAAHATSIRILHTLTPVGVAMASAKEFDPYKD